MIIGVGRFACGVWRDNRFAAPLRQPVSKPAGIIGAICEQFARSGYACQQGLGTSQIMSLPGRESYRERAPVLVRQRMNLGRPSAARSSDGVCEIPPFAPAAERCALTWVESTAVVLITPLDPVRA